MVSLKTNCPRTDCEPQSTLRTSVEHPDRNIPPRQQTRNGTPDRTLFNCTVGAILNQPARNPSASGLWTRRKRTRGPLLRCSQIENGDGRSSSSRSKCFACAHPSQTYLMLLVIKGVPPLERLRLKHSNRTPQGAPFILRPPTATCELGRLKQPILSYTRPLCVRLETAIAH
jgi:hypothetical protein